MLTYKDLLFTGPEAVCVLDASLNIKQHNQLAELLLGYRDKKLTGANLADIIYDDTLTHNLLILDGNSNWSQGECILKTGSNLPLAVKFRAGTVTDKSPSPDPSDSQFSQIIKEYVLVFKETVESQNLDYKRKMESMRFLLEVIPKRYEELEDILLGFARIFDQNAEVMLLPPDFAADKSALDEPFMDLTPSAIMAALKAESRKCAVFHCDESLWCFFPIYSEDEVYSIACLKFSVPRFYSEKDKDIFRLAGRTLGEYMPCFTSEDQKPSSQSLFRTIIDGIDQPVVVVDRNGVITLCNVAVQTVYGYMASEMVGRLFGDFVLPTDSFVRYEDILREALHGIPIHDEEMTHLCNDWTAVDVSVTAYPHKMGDGSIAGAIFILRDLSEEKRLWNKMMQWEKLAALGRLLTGVANELNNPLTTLTGYSQLMLHREIDEEIQSMISTIHKEAERCSNIVRSVLSLALGEGAQKEYTHVNNIITTVLGMKQRQLRPNNIDISVKLGENIPGTVAEPYDIERLFLRIVNYAEQRMLEYDNGGQIAVESAFEDGNIIVRFVDTGTCILRDDISEILDPFFTPNGQDEGIGLGLGISYQILRNIGGSIQVDNEMGKGNIVTVKLPILNEASSETPEPSEEVAACAPETGKRILVVDDEPTILDMIVVVLQQMGHITDIAPDGNEAMNKLRSGHYDLIITDLRMPSGFTGDRLHKFIGLKNPELAQRIIFMTGDVTNPETREFLQSTGNPYLEKPFTLENLRETVQISLSKREGR